MTSIWKAQMDALTCDNCRHADGESTDNFPPHAECRNKDGCRCVVVAIEPCPDHIMSNCLCERKKNREKAELTKVKKLVEDAEASLTPEQRELINHPSHYGGDGPYEHVKVAIALGWTHDAFIYMVTKYIWRFGRKDGEPSLRDLKKARWYLDRKIEEVEREGK